MSDNHEIIDCHTGEILKVKVKLKPLSSPLLNNTTHYENLLKCHDRRGMTPYELVLARSEKEQLFVHKNKIAEAQLLSKPDQQKFKLLCSAVKIKNVLVVDTATLENDILKCGKNNIHRALKSLIAKRFVFLENKSNNPAIRRNETKITLNPNCFYVRADHGRVPLQAVADFYKLVMNDNNYEYTNF